MKKKAKQLMAVATAVTMCASSLFAFTACGDTACEHEYEWTEKIAPTCTDKGLDTGKCKNCDDITFRETDAVAANHVYGAWQIEQPTATQAGKATKVCTANAEHDKLEVTLPATGAADNGYTVTDVTAATDITTGVKSYTLANSKGDITFTQAVSATGVTTVARAVQAATLKKSEVASGSAKQFYMTSDSSSVSATDYEYGDGYFHYLTTSAYGMEERYYSKVNGEMIGLEVQGDGTLKKLENYDEDDNPDGVKEDNLKGYGFDFTDGTCYGPEEYLAALYEWAKEDENGDFEESKTTKNGITYFEFSFGVYDDTFDQLNLANVSFALSSVYSLKELSIAMVSYPAEGEVWSDVDFDYISVPLFEQTEPDGPYTLTEAGLAYHEYTTSGYMITQYVKGEAPELPFDLNLFNATSFKVYNAEVDYMTWPATVTKLAEVSGTVQMEADVASYFLIDDILPTTANLNVDTLSVYLRAGNTDTLLGNDGNATAYFNADDKLLTLRSKVTGDVTFVLKTANYEKVLNANVTPAKPDTIDAVVYSYKEATDSYTSARKGSVTVYAGQSISIGVSVVRNEERDLVYINNAATFAAEDESQNPVNLSDDTIGGKAVKVFTATTVGVYTVTITSSADNDVFTELSINVVPTPTAAEILTGTWKNGGISAVFTPTSDGATTGTVDITIGADTGAYTYGVNSGVISLNHTGGEDFGCSMEITARNNVKLIKDGSGIVLAPWAASVEVMGTIWKYEVTVQDDATNNDHTYLCFLVFDAEEQILKTYEYEIMYGRDILTDDPVQYAQSYDSGDFTYTLDEQFISGKYAFYFEQQGGMFAPQVAVSDASNEDNGSYLDTTVPGNSIVVYIYSPVAGEENGAGGFYGGDVSATFVLYTGTEDSIEDYVLDTYDATLLGGGGW